MKKKIAKKNAITTVKVFNSEWTCRDFQFEVGKIYQHKGDVAVCESGFHSCVQPNHCFDYYSFDSDNKVAECRVWGKTDAHESDSKIASEFIEIVRELSWQEVLVLVNNGKNNTGRANSGNWNSGNWNSGDRNSGNRNSGNWNSGNRNSGNWNSGDSNSGDSNSGNRNSGNWNSGDSNSGDSNSGYRNCGAFCADENPEIWLFDKPSGITVREWEQSDAVLLMLHNLETEIWVYASEMSDKEKETNPHWETTDGYLKSVSLKEAWATAWDNFTDKNKKVFLDLPNFDAEKFLYITGIDIT